MKLDEIVAWYQKKIGTYDKQQWEKTVEQKILDGFSSVTLKTAKLKTEFIDVDLVRGSTFPKAKPKQTLLTVIRLAILRYLFLPVYAQWWVKQTSPNIFAILLLLYITQMVNWAIYTFNYQREDTESLSHASDGNSTLVEGVQTTEKHIDEHIVSMSELLIPMVLSLLISLIHSQIVATITASGVKAKHRRFSNASQTGRQTSRESRVRRRRRLVKMRNQESTDVSAVLPPRKSETMLKTLGNSSNSTDNLSCSFKMMPTEVTKEVINQNAPKMCSSPTKMRSKHAIIQESFFSTTTLRRRSPIKNAAALQHAAKLTLDLNHTPAPSTTAAATAEGAEEPYCGGADSQDCLVSKKRNVNWQSPIRNYAASDVAETQEKQQQTSPQRPYSASTTSTSDSNSPNNNAGASGSSCSNSANATPTKVVPVDDSVQEIFEDLITHVVPQPVVPAPPPGEAVVQTPRRIIGEDDGFESLNGKSSSGEETRDVTYPAGAAETGNQLRLRLNTNPDNHAIPTPANSFRRKIPLSSESEYEKKNRPASSCDAYQQTSAKLAHHKRDFDSSTDETDNDDEDDAREIEVISSPTSLSNTSNYNECTTSATEWLGVTTNSDDCSYSSELENSEGFKNAQYTDEEGYELDFAPATILNSHGTMDRISCTIWDQREIKKAQMSVLEISSCIIERVESMPETNDYIYIGIFFSVILSFVPCFCRLCEVTIESGKPMEINYFDVPMLLWEKASFSVLAIFRFAFGQTQWERAVLVIGLVQRLCLTTILFIIFAVAERTFKQRFLYAKLFSHLTSSRRARKSNLPHFRLNKVRNIKTWLSVRSYLKKRGPQRSVDVIVSAAFIVTLLLLAFLSVEWLKDSVQLHSQLNLEALMWSTTIGIFLLRFMTLGNKIHHKYRSVSVLITEQINLYLQIEQKPKKKDELMVSNSVLKLAADLLKELETPFKISGLSANPYLFTTVKVVILSALSGVLSEMLGFKLKLHKIKIK